MSEQVQCPNCGGYKVSDNSYPIDSATGTPVQKKGPMGCLLLLLIGSLTALVYPVAFASDGIDDVDEIIVMSMFVGFFVLSELLWIMTIIGTIRKNREIDKMLLIARTAHEYHCYICGYNWKWVEGDPKPEVKANPDLIVKGMQRLEEEAAAEEEARRKKEEEDFMMMQNLMRKR